MTIEKTCSRCAEVTWSSDGGISPSKHCRSDGNPCDTAGSIYYDGQLTMGRLEF